MSQISFVCTLLNGFKYSKWLNCSIWPIGRTLIGTSTLSKSEPGSNGNEKIFHILQSSRTRASLSDSLALYPGHLLKGILSLCWDAVGIFYSSIWLGCKYFQVNFTILFNMVGWFLDISTLIGLMVRWVFFLNFFASNYMVSSNQTILVSSICS